MLPAGGSYRPRCRRQIQTRHRRQGRWLIFAPPPPRSGAVIVGNQRGIVGIVLSHQPVGELKGAAILWFDQQLIDNDDLVIGQIIFRDLVEIVIKGLNEFGIDVGGDVFERLLERCFKSGCR